MYKLWLDDVRKAPSDWIHAKDFEEFKSYISSMGNPKEMNLDHDLGNKTGLDCVEWYLQWLVDTEQKCCKKITIHV